MPCGGINVKNVNDRTNQGTSLKATQPKLKKLPYRMALGSLHRKIGRAGSCDVRKQTNLHNPPSCEKRNKYSLFSLPNIHWKTKSVDTIRFYFASAIFVILVQN